MNRADSLKIVQDDQGFELHLEAEDGTHVFNIHMLALEFEAVVRRELRPYALEAEHARATMPASLDEQADGYDLSDPKHPTWLERVHAAQDMRGGRCV